MKAFVTGANGFTGSYLIKSLLKKGYEVRGLVRKTSDLTLIKDVDVELVYGDLTNMVSLDHLLEDVDVVFHTAAAYRIEGVPQKHFWDVNVSGTKKLFEAAKKNKIKKIIYLSTVGVQGNIKNPPAKEEDPYAPGDYYQQSKVEAEKLALYYFNEYNLPITIIRPVGIYGPGDTRFLKLFKHINNGSFRMLGSGKVLYHFTFIDDLVEGIILASENDKVNGEIITIGGDEFITLTELVKKIAGILNKPVNKLKIPVAPVWIASLIFEILCKPFGLKPPIYRRRVDFFIKHRAFDISKAKKLLGYKPKFSLDEGLKITVEWYKKNKYLVN